MTEPDLSERAFEDAIEAHLLASGYRKRLHTDYDRGLCLDPGPLFDFLNATQPKEWARYSKEHGADARSKLLQRISSEIARHGSLSVLRDGVKSNGGKFRLAFFPPNSGLNPEVARLHEANQHTVVRQLRYSAKNENSLDVVLFLNGVPLITAELKNPLTGQTVEHALHQLRNDRDPREPLFALGRCVGHFAVDPHLVCVTTELAGAKTRFLPFDRGNNGGKGNPAGWKGYATAYLWEDVWSPASVLELVQHFLHVVEVEDDKGKRTGQRRLDFPRFHQRDAVRKLVTHARTHGAGRRYLIQHSAGSGKSNTIAWLAHRLAVLHDASDQRVFDSIVVVTDRRVLDRQLRRTVRAFSPTEGVVEAVEQGSTQLADALQKGRDIITTTLQKFPFVIDKVGELPGKRFAVIIDEAHSSQTGEASAKLKKVLDTSDLDAAERDEEAEDGPNPFEALLDDEPRSSDAKARAQQKSRKWPDNVSVFAFTATPKSRTLELFGEKKGDGTFEPFSLYSMRQAIEEGFILDVLERYTTYGSYWELRKQVESDPRFEKRRAMSALKAFAERQDEAIRQKIAVVLDHFDQHVAAGIGGQAKAMLVTRSRAHAVLYKLALDRALVERGASYRALVAFSGTVKHDGHDYTESAMNGLPETQTADTFGTPDYRIMVVANKFQTGFDQPLLASMYVDKKLGGVAAVQTLSRLNRTIPGRKLEVFVLDFANEADAIQKAFQPYYEKTLLSEATNPDLLHDLEGKVLRSDVVSEADVMAFADLFFRDGVHQHELYAALRPAVDRFVGLYDDERKAEFRAALDEFVRLYSFLSQVIAFEAVELERLYVFGRALLRVLPPPKRGGLPPELLHSVALGAYRTQEKGTTKIALERGPATLDPQGEKDPQPPAEDEAEELSKILKTLNERFGTSFSAQDRVFVEELERRLDDAPALVGSLAVNPADTVKITFENLVSDTLQEMMDANFTLYQRVTDDEAFGRFFVQALFERFLRRSKDQ